MNTTGQLVIVLVGAFALMGYCLNHLRASPRERSTAAHAAAEGIIIAATVVLVAFSAAALSAVLR